MADNRLILIFNANISTAFRIFCFVRWLFLPFHFALLLVLLSFSGHIISYFSSFFPPLSPASFTAQKISFSFRLLLSLCLSLTYRLWLCSSALSPSSLHLPPNAKFLIRKQWNFSVIFLSLAVIHHLLLSSATAVIGLRQFPAVLRLSLLSSSSSPPFLFPFFTIDCQLQTFLPVSTFFSSFYLYPCHRFYHHLLLFIFY